MRVGLAQTSKMDSANKQSSILPPDDKNVNSQELLNEGTESTSTSTTTAESSDEKITISPAQQESKPEKTRKKGKQAKTVKFAKKSAKQPLIDLDKNLNFPIIERPTALTGVSVDVQDVDELPSLSPTNVLIDQKEHRMELVVDSNKQYSGLKFTFMKKGKDYLDKAYKFKELVAVSHGFKKVLVRKGVPLPKKSIRKKNLKDFHDPNAQPELVGPAFERVANRLFLYFILRKSCRKQTWAVHEIKVEFLVSDVCKEWAEKIEQILQCIENRPKQLLCFLNPFGGKRMARKIYENVKPVFELAGIEIVVIETQRANHALDDVRDREDLLCFDGVVAVGGDGLFNEVLCGLVMREQRNRNIDCNSLTSKLARPKLRIGLIPAGSTNSLAHTVLGTEDPLTAALHIVIGDESAIDVCGVYENSNLLRFCCTVASFGFLGDLLKDSEDKRALGPIRYKVSGLKMFFKHPAFLGRVGVAPIFSDDSPDMDAMRLTYRNFSNMNACHSECSVCGKLRSGSLVSGLESPQSIACPDTLYTRHITDKFVHVVAIITPCLSRLTPDGLSPSSHLGDGTIDLGLVAGISRRQNATFMVEAMSKGANHIRRSFMHMFRVSRFSYTPMCCLDRDSKRKRAEDLRSLDGTEEEEEEWEATMTGNTSARSYRIREKTSAEIMEQELEKGRDSESKVYCGTWNIDGEILEQPRETLHFRVHRQLVKLFARGIEVIGEDSGDRGCCTCCGGRKRHSSAVD